MQSLDKRRVDYFTPDVPPTEEAALPEWLFNQVTNLSESISNVNSMHLTEMYHWPDGYKPREGDIIWAGEGLLGEESTSGMYAFMHGVWVPISGGASGGGGVPIGGIIMWSGSLVPDGWALCDGSNAPDGTRTPNLVSQFVKGSDLDKVGETGGSGTSGGTALSTAQMPKHSHTMSHTHNIASHSHSIGNHTHTQEGTFTTDTKGSHNHGTKVVTGLTNHSQGGTSSRDYPRPLENLASDGSHSHSVTISGETGSSGSGNTGGSGSLTTAGASNATTSEVGSGNAHTHSIDPPYYSLAYIMRYE